MGDGYIGTFDDQITVKLWKYEKEQVILVKQTAINIRFTGSEPAVFKSFYLDCLNHIAVAYHHQNHLLALTVRHNLFFLNMETMECTTMDIPPLKKNTAQLSCLWKNLVFSENAETVKACDQPAKSDCVCPASRWESSAGIQDAWRDQRSENL